MHNAFRYIFFASYTNIAARRCKILPCLMNIMDAWSASGHGWELPSQHRLATDGSRPDRAKCDVVGFLGYTARLECYHRTASLRGARVHVLGGAAVRD